MKPVNQHAVFKVVIQPCAEGELPQLAIAVPTPVPVQPPSPSPAPSPSPGPAPPFGSLHAADAPTSRPAGVPRRRNYHRPREFLGPEPAVHALRRERHPGTYLSLAGTQSSGDRLAQPSAPSSFADIAPYVPMQDSESQPQSPGSMTPVDRPIPVAPNPSPAAIPAVGMQSPRRQAAATLPAHLRDHGIDTHERDRSPADIVRRLEAALRPLHDHRGAPAGRDGSGNAESVPVPVYSIEIGPQHTAD